MKLKDQAVLGCCISTLILTIFIFGILGRIEAKIQNLYDKGFQAGYNKYISDYHIPAPGLEKVKTRNANLIEKCKG